MGLTEQYRRCKARRIVKNLKMRSCLNDEREEEQNE